MGLFDPVSDRRSVAVGLALGAIVTPRIGREWLTGPEPTAAQVQTGERPGEGAGELAGIGLPFNDWQTIFGAGTAIDEAGGLYEFDNPELPGLTLLASFEDGLARHVEFGYEESELGGLPLGPVIRQIMGLLPGDAASRQRWSVGGTNLGSVTYRYQRYQSDRLAQATGGRDAVLIGFQEQNVFPDGGSVGQLVTLRATATLESRAESRSGSGIPGGIGLPLADFQGAYGLGEPAQSGIWFEGLAAGGGDILAGVASQRPTVPVTSLRFTYDEVTADGGITPGEADVDIVGALPADARRTGVFTLPPTPDGPIGLLVEQWQSEALGDVLSGADTALSVTWQVDAGSAGTVVSRIDLLAQDDA